MSGLANSLRDFAQSASNSIAGNISAPVDGIAWGLRKLGVPVPPKPVGGSDWMTEKGFTPPVKQGLAQLLGEAAGMTGPMVAAAKAPQIAKSLLQGADNLMAPRTLNPQTGAIVWHGSPHKFDKFDSSKIGTGEGNQSYGHGLYFAESPDVAKSYAEQLAMRSSGQTPAQIKAAIKQTMDTMQGPLRMQRLAGLRADLDIAKQTSRDGPQTYKVDLPDEHIAKMLNYDAPVASAIHEPLSKAAMNEFGSGLTTTSGDQLYKEMVFNFRQAGHKNPKQAATDWLSSQGVPGMKYLDSGSRGGGGVGSSTSNFVVFPGNEGLLKILERNGQGIP